MKQLSKIAGVTPRTLHYYDEIDLLKPTQVRDNGYRYYGDEALLRLQQILLYRELDMPLENIKCILGRSDFDVLAALERHQTELQRRIAKMEQLRATVADTIQYLKGTKTMSQKQLFAPFTEEQQTVYEQEAMQAYDPATVKASIKKWKNYSTAEKERIGQESNAIYQDFLRLMPQGADAAEVQACVERWRRSIEYFWTPNDEQLLGLVNGYNDDPNFKANFDKIDPALAPFMREAVTIYVNRKKN